MLNTRLLITARDAVGLIYATYEYGSLGFSVLSLIFLDEVVKL
jgi:hypothetical protein